MDDGLDLVVVSVEGFDLEIGAEESIKLSTRICLEVVDFGEFGELEASLGSSFLWSTSFDFEALFAGEPEGVESLFESSL